MADHFEATIKTKVGLVQQSTVRIHASADHMAHRSTHSGSRSLTVSDAVQVTSDRTNQAAQATEALIGSVGGVSERVSQSTQIARQAVADVTTTSARMSDLSKAVQQIGDVVLIINDIASQTNLLALNATIEAARAGEAGKGFAVVANEVKTLASQTAKATETIGTQVRSVQASAEEMQTSISGVVETIQRMNGISAEIAEAVREQNDATKSIAHDIQEVSQQADTVRGNVRSLSVDSVKSSAGTVKVIWCATDLADIVKELSEETESFLELVRK